MTQKRQSLTKLVFFGELTNKLITYNMKSKYTKKYEMNNNVKYRLV